MSNQLPTREELRKYLSGGLSGFDERQYNGMMDVCWAYADGRLIDRGSIDPLAACVGYGIEYQEAVDIVNLALAGRNGLNELGQRLYDDVALGRGRRR